MSEVVQAPGLTLPEDVIRPGQILALATQLNQLAEPRRDLDRSVLLGRFRDFCAKRGDFSFVSGLERKVLGDVKGKCPVENPALQLLDWLLTMEETLRVTRQIPVRLIQTGVRRIATFLIVYDRIMASQMAFARGDKASILRLERQLVGCASGLGQWFLPLLNRFRAAFPRYFEGELGAMATYVDDSCLHIQRELLALPS